MPGRGFHIYFSVGSWGGIRVQVWKDSLVFRLALGWFAISIGFMDVDFILGTYAELVREKFEDEDPKSSIPYRIE